MAFKPKSESNFTGGTNPDFGTNFPVPRAGSRKARVSLIIDLGRQVRKPIYKVGEKIVDEDTEGAVRHDQKPCQQVAVFADLVADVVDYGGNIGKAQYRLMLNKSFQGKIEGINFQKVPPKDPKGNTIQGKPWTLHPANVLTKLAKATGATDVIESAEIDKLLDLPFMATVEVKITPDKNGKKDKDGNVIEYKNVNFKGAAEVPEDDDGNPIEVAPLKQPALCITFDDAKPEHIKFIRPSILAVIKQAEDYEGSQMQKAIEAYEKQQKEAGSSSNDSADEQEEDQEEAAPAPTPKKKPPVKKQPVPTDDDESDDIPF